jgi:hypothetical protein
MHRNLAIGEHAAAQSWPMRIASAAAQVTCPACICAGITQERVEEMEARLKEDILSEAKSYEGQILVTDENDDFTTFDLMLQVSASDVQTPREVFDELLEDGYNVQYERIPVTDEKVGTPVTCCRRRSPECILLPLSQEASVRCRHPWPGPLPRCTRVHIEC